MPRYRRKAAKWSGSVYLCAVLFCSCAQPPPTSNSSSDSRQPAAASEAPRAAVENDHALQLAAAEALGDREGAVLAMDPQTGRIRAVVNPRLAFEQSFPPGSTIKSFTALMALRAGLVDGDTRSVCRGTFKRDDFQITCSHPKSKSPFDVSQALAYSCNVFFAGLSERLSPASFRATLATFGFGERTGVNAQEASGSISAGEWHVRDGVGEGSALLVTPLQLLMAYAALFNGGRLFRPQLSEPNGFKSDEKATLPIDELHRALLIKGCRGTVEYGTAAEAGLGSLPFFVFGKTGTAAASNEFRRYGWFVGFASDQNSASREVPGPESLHLALLVFLKHGHGWEAASVAKKIFENGGLKKVDAVSRTEDRGSRMEDRCSSMLSRASSLDPRSSILHTPPSDQVIRVRVLREGRTLRLPLEDYLLGVMAVEASVEDQVEALKAQAIISRTYALKNLGRHAAEGYDLCSNTHCQQFVTGKRAEIREVVRAAVNETAGQVLVDESGRLIDAYFSASCGGMTANIESLWGSPAPVYLRGVRDDYCSTGPHRNWIDRVPQEKLLRALRADPRSDVGRILEDIVITKRDATGRAERIAIEGEHRRELRGWEFKLIVGRALGWNFIKSTRFELARRGGMFEFRGSGFGHGLGLCQEGAHVMARRGNDCKSILGFYFPRTRIEPRPAAAADGRVGEALASGSRRRASVSASVEHATFPERESALGRALSIDERVLASEHFRVRYSRRTSQSDVEVVLNLFEAARNIIARKLDAASLPLSEEQMQVIVHDTTAEFVSATGQPSFASGATRAREIHLQPLSILRRRRILESATRHEYAHAVIETLGAGRCPRWLAEGMAIHFAGEGRFYQREAKTAPISIADIERRIGHPGSAAEMRSLYAAAYFEVKRLIDKDGESAVWRRIGRPDVALAILSLNSREIYCGFRVDSRVM